MKRQVQRIGARSRRYDHDPQQLPDGRWLVTRQWAAHHSDRNIDHIRKVAEAQRRRWTTGDREDGEEPIEVLCTLHPTSRRRVSVLLDVDALTEAIAGRPFADWKRRKPLEVE